MRRRESVSSLAPDTTPGIAGGHVSADDPVLPDDIGPVIPTVGAPGIPGADARMIPAADASVIDDADPPMTPDVADAMTTGDVASGNEWHRSVSVGVLVTGFSSPEIRDGPLLL